jgi:hypothetical protein
LKILEDKIDTLIKLKKVPEAIEVCKRLFHLSTSFVSVAL